MIAVRNNILKLSVMGFIIGMAVGNLIAILTGFLSSQEQILIFSETLLRRTGSEAGALLAQTLVSGIYGAVCMGGVCVYEIEEWPLLRATLTHYVLIVVCFVPTAVWAGWIRLALPDCAISLSCQTIAYFIIWLIMYARYQAEVRELNTLLEEQRKEGFDYGISE